MKYITRDDIIEIIQGRLLDESISELPNEILDGLESKAIDFAISYISGKYDTKKIFDAPEAPASPSFEATDYTQFPISLSYTNIKKY